MVGSIPAKGQCTPQRIVTELPEHPVQGFSEFALLGIRCPLKDRGIKDDVECAFENS